MVVLQLVSIWLATIVSGFDVESIIVSGPVISILGIIICLLGLLKRDWWVALTGISALFYSMLVFIFIASFEITPVEAQQPVPMFNATYAMLMTPNCILMVLRRLFNVHKGN